MTTDDTTAHAPPSFEDCKARLKEAHDAALAQILEMIGTPFPVPVDLTVEDDPAFHAQISPTTEGVRLTIASGVVQALDQLWREAFATPDLFSDHEERLVEDPEPLIRTSLIWLILHELCHQEMDHFRFTGQEVIGETGDDARFNLVRRVGEHPVPALALPKADQTCIAPCLEMQADHEAVEYVLDAYSTERWTDLRLRIAAIFAVMLLIDREDRQAAGPSPSHPLAATRMFQLLGHVTQMPFLPALLAAQEEQRDVDPEELPSDEEVAAFQATVIQPTVMDALALAGTAGAVDVAASLGDPTDLIADIQTAMTEGVGQGAAYKTDGAQEWARLAPVNERIKAAMGWDGLTVEGT